MVCKYYLLAANYSSVKNDLKNKGLLTTNKLKEQIELFKLTSIIDYCESFNQTLDEKEIEAFREKISVIYKRETNILALLTEFESERKDFPNCEAVMTLIVLINKQVNLLRLGLPVLPVFTSEDYAEGERTESLERVIQNVVLPYFAR